MFDTLDGLDYRTGECAYYVSKILSDMKLSEQKSDIIRKSRDEIEIGDVIVASFSSHLVTNDNDQYRLPLRGENEKLLVIPKSVLERLRKELDIQ